MVVRFPGGAAVAVSLSFDDARASQLDGVRILDEHGVLATFYVLPSWPDQASGRWREVAAAGHEIGNHTRTHPCSGDFEFSRDNALEDLTLAGIAAEIDGAGTDIEERLGVVPRTFAYPCGQAFVGRGDRRRSYVPLVAERFVAGRGYRGETGNDPWRCDLARLDAYAIDGVDAAGLWSMVEGGMAHGEWVVMAGHDVGRQGPQTVLAGALDTLCRRLVRDDRVWVAPVVEVAEHVLAARRGERSG